MTLSTLSVLLAGLALAPQEGGAAGPQIQAPTPQGQPAPNPRAIPDIREYRGAETVPYVRRLEDVRQLDLSQVNFSAPVLGSVNGVPITQDDFRLWLAFTGGQNGVLRAQLTTLANDMMKRIVEETGDDSQFAVIDDDVARRISEEEDMARAQGEEFLTGYRERINDTLGMDHYKEFVRAHLVSERLLLPPIKTLEEAGDQLQSLPVESAELLDDQPQMRDYLNNAYMSGQDFPAMFRTQFLRMLQEKMIEHADIRYAIEEQYGSRFPRADDAPAPLADGVYMSVNGTDTTLDEILAFVPNSQEVKETALRLLLLYRAMDDELVKHDALMSPDDFALIFDAHEAEYEGTLFPLRNLISLRGFLNMPEYREYYRRRAAFRNMYESSMTPEALETAFMAHHQKYGKLFYQSGKVTVQTAYSSLDLATDAARAQIDQEGGASSDNASSAGWAAARALIEDAYAELQSGKTFAEVRETVLEGHTLTSTPTGVLDGKMRNEIRNAIAETEYAIFMAGYSLADDLFYNRQPGERVGPVAVTRSLLPGLKGGLGYLVAEATEFAFITPLKPFDQQKALVTSDYFDLMYTYWAHECLKSADIVLTTQG